MSIVVTLFEHHISKGGCKVCPTIYPSIASAYFRYPYSVLQKTADAIWQYFDGSNSLFMQGSSILSVLNELETIAPVVAVQGNIESEEVMSCD